MGGITFAVWVGMIAIALIVWGCLRAGYGKSDPDEFDERQRRSQGNAYKYGFWVGIGYLFLLQFVELVEYFPLTIHEVSIIGILVMLMVYGTVAIWRDAYISLGENETARIVLMLAMGIWNLMDIRNLTSLLVGVASCYMAGLLTLRRYLRKREEREEDDG